MTTYVLLMLSIATGNVTAVPVPFQTIEACAFASNNVTSSSNGATQAWCTATNGKKFPGQPGGIR